jgi:hypothetical protein
MSFSTANNTLLRLLALLALGLGALAGATNAAGRTQEARTAAAPPPVPVSGAYFGARAAPAKGQSEVDAINTLEQLVGRRFAIDHYYEPIGDTLPSKEMIASANAGRYPLVDLDADAWTWPSIVSGAADSALKAEADGIAAWGKPCFLNFDHEPESYGGSHGTPADFVAAWRHVVGIFRGEGATNCSWVWILEAQTFSKSAAASSWYPGDQYVDWVSADGYDWYPGKPRSSWRELSSIFGPLQSWAALLHPGKPVMIGETGVQEDPANPTRKATWFENALATMKSWPQFKAFVYFNSTSIYDWLVNSSSASLSAFSAIGADPYFNP